MLSCIPCTPCVCGIFLCVEQIDGGSKIFYDNLCRNRLGLILGFQLGASSVCGQPTHLGWRRRPYIFRTSNFLLLREFSCGFEGGYNYKTFSGKFHRNVFSLLHDDFSWYAFVCNSDYMFCRIVHKIFWFAGPPLLPRQPLSALGRSPSTDAFKKKTHFGMTL